MTFSVTESQTSAPIQCSSYDHDHDDITLNIMVNCDALEIKQTNKQFNI